MQSLLAEGVNPISVGKERLQQRTPEYWGVKILSWGGAKTKLLVMLIVLLLVFFLSFYLGRYPVSPDKVILILLSKVASLPQTWTDMMETVVVKVRLPRIAAAILVGSALAASGAAYQNLFRNPLVSPMMVGASWGAGFGAVLGMVLHLPRLVIQASAFSFGVFAVLCAVCISALFGNKSMVTLVLGGMVVSFFFQALIHILIYLADPYDTLQTITFWLMGGVGKITLNDVEWAFLPISVALIMLYIIRWQVNVLSVGEEEAQTLGINIRCIQMLVLACATLLASAAVSISGILTWVGLLIPHMARMLVGTNFAMLLPASVLMGGTYLLLIDDLSRSIFSVEIQVGILTALIGAPFFVFLLAKARKGLI
jgi:iron complex transport system permease protein